MNDSTIGIRIADGSFYPILDDLEKKNKRLVLTTVRDNQESVQIDLYRGFGKELENARYIGSLMIENIETAGKGVPEVELIIGIDSDGNLNATAGDKATGERQSLSVSLTALDESDMYDMPDFELEDDMEALGGITPEEESRLTSEELGDYSEEEAIEEEEPEETIEEKKKHPLLLIGFIVLGLAVIVILAILLFKNLNGQEVPPLKAEGETGMEIAADAVPESRPAEPEAVEVTEQAPPEPAAPAVPSAPPPPTGVWYTIVWGDTLWDISTAFYKTPWLYPFLAKENNIRDPDFILANSSIFIPAR